MAPKKIAVMTSGGDSPGMNACVRAVVRMSIHLGCDAYCIYEGYEGLVQGGDLIRKMDFASVRGFLSDGGTNIGTARCMAFYERSGRIKAAKNLVLSGIDALIICGGDGSLTGADRFRAEWPSLLDELVANGDLTEDQTIPHKHLNICGLVGSIDNDLSGTDSTIGCYSALARICEDVQKIEATASSHSRCFRRSSGWLALAAATATGADFVFIPEQPRPNWKDEMRAVVTRHREWGKRKTIVIVAEGARDGDGNSITSNEIKQLAADKEGLNLDAKVTVLGHVQRGGAPVAYDRMLATLQGVEAVKCVLEATPESETCFIAINENKIVRKPLMQAVIDTHEVAKAVEAKDFKKAMSLRDTEFADMYSSYLTTTNVMVDDNKLPTEKRMKIAFINVGAPAGGVNAALRAGVAYCLSRGHEPIAIHNGFSGFARHHSDPLGSSVRPFNWLDVDNAGSRGGTEIGTNRETPVECGLKNIADLIQQYAFDAMFIIGGFEAFQSLSQLRIGREKHASLRIPMCLLPATISNSIPGSEYSLGSDTCLNQLVEHCDVIKQSASASRRRVFVVETQGGRSGYVATVGGLCVGASATYTPEEGVTLDMVRADVHNLKQIFGMDKGQSRAGRLILVNEKASDVYDAEFISRIIRNEANGRFDARASTPGHYLQGLTPSAMDRCRAVRLAIRCMQHLEGFKTLEKPDESLSAAVIGIQGSEVVFTAMKHLEEEETDWPNRRPKQAAWMEVREVVDIMGNRH